MKGGSDDFSQLNVLHRTFKKFLDRRGDTLLVISIQVLLEAPSTDKDWLAA
jgi:hypothetical protein